MIEIQAQRGMANQTHKRWGAEAGEGTATRKKSCGLVLHTRYLSAMIELKGIKIGVLWVVGWLGGGGGGGFGFVGWNYSEVESGAGCVRLA